MSSNSAAGRTGAKVESVGLRLIVERVEVSFDDRVDMAVEKVVSAIPQYGEIDGLRQDLTEHVRAVLRLLLTSLAGDRPIQAEDFAVTRLHAIRRVRQGVPLPAFLQAFRIGHRSVWDGVLEAASDDPRSREAALLIVERIFQVIEMASVHAVEAYTEAQQAQIAEIDRLRREVIEDLLVGADVSADSKQAVLRATGLDSGRPAFVIVATAVAPLPAGRSLTDALAVLVRERSAGSGLTIVRQDEIVGLLPASATGSEPMLSMLERAVEELARRGIELAVGMSTRHTALHDVPEAYAEAIAARDGLRASCGVLALSTMGALDYLIMSADETARRLIRPTHRKFVDDDAEKGGVLATMLLEYVASDLNATAAARRLHLHVNTVYYRLERIAEKSGCDLRRFSELQELVAAVRLLRRG